MRRARPGLIRSFSSGRRKLPYQCFVRPVSFGAGEVDGRHVVGMKQEVEAVQQPAAEAVLL